MRVYNFFSKVSCLFFSLVALAVIACSNDDNSSTSSSSGLPVLKGTDFASQADFAFECIKLMHPKMTEVWPGDSTITPENFNLMMVYVSKEDLSDLQMYFVNAREKTNISNPQQLLNSDAEFKKAFEEMASNGYCKALYNNTKVCLVNYAETPKNKEKYKLFNFTDLMISLDHLDTFYHESFHFYVQAKTWGNATGKDRDQVYPIDFTPRTYRVLANLKLWDAYKNFSNDAKRADYYSQAKYWYDKYNTECESEAKRISLNDINEGTANYFGKAVLHSIFSDSKPFEELEGRALASTVDDESYSLGSIALTLIKKEGKISDSVTKFIANKNNEDSIAATPVALLLANVQKPASYDEKVDATVIKEINTQQENIYGKNSTYGKKLEEAITYYTSGNKTYILDMTSGNEDTGTYSISSLSNTSCMLDIYIDTPRTKVSNVTCFYMKFKIPNDHNTDGSERYLLPVESVTFTPDENQPNPLPQFGKGTKNDSYNGDLPEEWLTDVAVGKISAISQVSGKDIVLKDDAKTKEVYKGKDKAGNTFYIFTEIADTSKKDPAVNPPSTGGEETTEEEVTQ